MDNRLLLLGLLRQQEMHGYQLNEFIEREMAYCTDLKRPTAYYLLGKMTEEGWIVEEQEQQGNRPIRRVYRLTPEGEQAYQRLLRENLSGFTTTNFSDDTGIAFLDDLPPEETIRLLRQRQNAIQEALQMAMEAIPQHQGRLKWVIEHQVRYLSQEREWVGEMISRIETSDG